MTNSRMPLTLADSTVGIIAVTGTLIMRRVRR